MLNLALKTVSNATLDTSGVSSSKRSFFDNCCFFFREKHGWDAKASLLMDGLFENSAINLRKVFILYESETGNDYPHFFKFSKTGHLLAG